ncbi:hypothetical protein ACS0TY_023491 [Phlomoides rotata]
MNPVDSLPKLLHASSFPELASNDYVRYYLGSTTNPFLLTCCSRKYKANGGVVKSMQGPHAINHLAAEKVELRVVKVQSVQVPRAPLHQCSRPLLSSLTAVKSFPGVSHDLFNAASDF